MNQSTSYIMTKGGNNSMQNYEIDRLFGQAVTDRRFFRQLCEQPHQILTQFELDELETQAVLGIALQVSTVGELAAQLDAWMTQRTKETNVAMSISQTSPGLQSQSLSQHAELDPPQRVHEHTYQSKTAPSSRRNEQRICLKLREYASLS